MEIVSISVTPIVEVAKCFFVPLGRQTGYIVHYLKNVRSLNHQLAELGSRRDEVKRHEAEALRRGEIIDFSVEEWFNKVEEIEDDVKELLDVVEERKSTSPKSNCLPHLRSRHKLSRKAIEKLAIISQLKRDGNFNSISKPGPPPSIDSYTRKLL